MIADTHLTEEMLPLGTAVRVEVLATLGRRKEVVVPVPRINHEFAGVKSTWSEVDQKAYGTEIDFTTCPRNEATQRKETLDERAEMSCESDRIGGHGFPSSFSFR